MPEDRLFDIGIVTDEVSRDLRSSMKLSAEWGISRFELREGGESRFPEFTGEEIGIVDEEIKHGAVITAVSPGIFKGHIEDVQSWQREAESVFPKSIELAQRFSCNVIIAFGFEECDASAAGRLNVLRAFEKIGEMAAAAGMTIALENEPGFWIDRPEETVSIIEELGHPAVRLNWDAANLHWSGRVPDPEAFHVLKPYIVNIHLKDYSGADGHDPWSPLGEGIVPWPELLPEVINESTLRHGTIETHCKPLIENSQKSLETLRKWLAEL